MGLEMELEPEQDPKYIENKGKKVEPESSKINNFGSATPFVSCRTEKFIKMVL